MNSTNANGIVTNTHLSIPDNEWYTTISTDEIIPFLDHYSLLRNINSITLFANSTKLKISLCRINNETDKVVEFETDKFYIEPSAVLENGMINFNALKVYGALGQQIKYISNFY